jgi:hypothetical protein
MTLTVTRFYPDHHRAHFDKADNQTVTAIEAGSFSYS